MHSTKALIHTIMLLASLAACGGSRGPENGLDGSSGPPPPDPEPAVFHLLLFSVDGADEPDGRIYDSLITGVTLSSGLQEISESGQIQVWADRAYVQGFYASSANHQWDIGEFQTFASGGTSSSTWLDLLSSGEGDTTYDHVSYAVLTSGAYSCFDILCTGGTYGDWYILFGEETQSMPSPSSLTYLGEWQGRFTPITGADNINSHQPLAGDVVIQVSMDGSLTGTLFSEFSDGLPLSDIVLTGSVSQNEISGTASAIRSTPYGDEYLQTGEFSGKFFGEGADELGGLFGLIEATPDPDTGYEYITTGAFVAD